MSDRIFKQTERDFWLYPKLLLVVIGCAAFTAILDRWFSDSLAVTVGLVPFFALFYFIGRPVTYKQWLLRIILVLLYVFAIALVIGFGRQYLSFVS